MKKFKVRWYRSKKVSFPVKFNITNPWNIVLNIVISIVPDPDWNYYPEPAWIARMRVVLLGLTIIGFELHDYVYAHEYWYTIFGVSFHIVFYREEV